MPSKYVDNTAIIQVLGGIYNNPSLLDLTDKYNIDEEDFVSDFHKIVFGAIYKIHELGVKENSIELINDFLKGRPKNEAVFKNEKGDEWLLKASERNIISSFDYYYNRLKKFTLLRAFDNCGIDVSDIYDMDNILDIKKKQAQEDYLDNSPLEGIAKIIQDKVDSIILHYTNDTGSFRFTAGDGIFDLIEQFKQEPEIGVPLYGKLINRVTRGRRLGKFYLRSRPTGVGKTRSLIADICNIGCDEIYDSDLGIWLKNGVKEPCLFIATEQDLSEVQTMMLAFLANVNEEHILEAHYDPGEEERILHAAEILQKSKIYVEVVPDFSLGDIENIVKRNIRDNQVRYIALDYIHTSMKILEEITRRSGGVRLREDNILFLLSAKLKEICVKYNVFIISATQLNGQYTSADVPDQNLLRGAKSIRDKADYGSILLPVNQEDIDKLNDVLRANGFSAPRIKLSVYKNRRGSFSGIYLWCNADLGTCRINPVFATNFNYDVIQISDLKIKIKDEKSAF